MIRNSACTTQPVVGTVDAVVIGAGHAGLAMSHCLTDRSIDHVVLERGEVANSWRNERWDSLRLLTPRWQSRLPGCRYNGSDPDGFMTMSEVLGRGVFGILHRVLELPRELLPAEKSGSP